MTLELSPGRPRWPAADDSTRDAAASPACSSGAALRLLVVDDEPEFTELIATVATEIGFSVVEISDSRSFAAVYDDSIDVVVLDLTMPGVDGIELIRYLADKRSRAAVVLMSGFDTHVLHSAQHLASTRGLRVTGVLQKPIQIGVLETALKRSSLPDDAPVRVCNDYIPDARELREAIVMRALDVHFQPKVRIADGKVFGVEALARWSTPSRGYVSPIAFVALAEQQRLIGAMTELIVDLALKETARLAAKDFPLNVALNLSPLLLDDIGLPDRLARKAAQSGVDPHLITFEVTESAIVDNIETSLDVLTRLRMKGFDLSIDDFGTGYSSLVQLKRIPFTELKIDQSFVSASDTDEAARCIVQSTVELGRRLGLKIVAEGVETWQEMALLANMQCEFAQGYLIARPMPADALVQWLGQWSDRRIWPPRQM